MSDTEEEFHIPYLDDNMTIDDEEYDIFLRSIGHPEEDKDQDLPDLQLRIAAAYIRVGLKIARDVGSEKYYEFTASVSKTVSREMDELEIWAVKHLDEIRNGPID